MRLTLIFLMIACCDSVAQAQPMGADSLSHPRLRTVLLGMYDLDRAVRKEMLAQGWGQVDAVDLQRQQEIDTMNVRLLARLVNENGWPTPAMVGEQGVDAAMRIVMHGNHAFHKEMLPHVLFAYQQGDVSAGDYALLLDQVLIGDGFPQRYGTQAEIREDRLVILPIEDSEQVDARRASIGLEPLAKYVEKLEELYGVKPSQ